MKNIKYKGKVVSISNNIITIKLNTNTIPYLNEQDECILLKKVHIKEDERQLSLF